MCIESLLLGRDQSRLTDPDNFVPCFLLQNGNSTPYVNRHSLMNRVGSETCASILHTKKTKQTNPWESTRVLGEQ